MSKGTLKDDIERICMEIIEEIRKQNANEGMDLDYDKKEVAFNDKHQKGVVTDLSKLPYVYSVYVGIPGFERVTAYSILRRTDLVVYQNNEKSIPQDGNPLIYAFKNERGWKFRSKADKKLFVDVIKGATDKLSKYYPIGFSIMIPSANNLNSWFASVIKGYCKNATICDTFLRKLSANEVLAMAKLPNSKIMKLPNKNDAKKFIDILTKDVEKMNEKGGVFRSHLLSDSDLRNLIANTMTYSSDEQISKLSRYINGKDIFLIDDTISKVRSIKEAISIITTCFYPKSISVLTLFSEYN